MQSIIFVTFIESIIKKLIISGVGCLRLFLRDPALTVAHDCQHLISDFLRRPRLLAYRYSVMRRMVFSDPRFFAIALPNSSG